MRRGRVSGNGGHSGFIVLLLVFALLHNANAYNNNYDANKNNKEDLLQAIDYLNLSYPLAIKYNEVKQEGR